MKLFVKLILKQNVRFIRLENTNCFKLFFVELFDVV